MIARNSERQLVLRQTTVLAAGAALACTTHGGGPMVIHVYVCKFTFTPDKIALERNVPVMFELTGQDILTGLLILDSNVRTNAVPGQTIRLAFMPGKTGTFDFLYDIFCGFDYKTTNGTLIAT